MILGCGIDIVNINRFKKIIHKWDHRFLKKVFTDREINYCEGKKKNRYQSYAGFFAAKEAYMKALGTGFRNVKWKEIEIIKNLLGKPLVSVSDRATKVGNNEKYFSTHLSISHTEESAIAQVIIEN